MSNKQKPKNIICEIWHKILILFPIIIIWHWPDDGSFLMANLVCGMRKYVGKIRLGNKDYELRTDVKNNCLKFITNLIDMEKVKSYIEKENIKSYIEKIPFIKKQLNSMIDEMRTEFTLKEYLPECIHPILGKSIEIDLDKNGIVVNIYRLNHEKHPMDDWYIFSKGLAPPDDIFLGEIQKRPNAEKIQEARADAV